MEVKEGFIKVPREEVEISTVLACGQSFRWKNDPDDPSELIGVFGHHLWILKQNDTSISYKVIKTAINPSTPVSVDFDELLRQYFQLQITLPSLYKRWAEKDEKFASLTLKDYQGIRILAQDPIENLFSFICSSNNHIQRISSMVEKLCLFYGEKIADYKGKSYYDFPEVDKLMGEKVEKKLRDESFGYRAGFIAKTAEKIVANGGGSWVEGLRAVGYDEARTQLQTLPGIGRKVADCICLMSLGYPEAIPVDTHIHQVAKVYLPHLAKVKTLTEKVYSEITDFFHTMYGDYAGWAHSVLFASTLRHLKSSEGKEKPAKKRSNSSNGKSKKDEDIPDVMEVKSNGIDLGNSTNKITVKVDKSSIGVSVSEGGQDTLKKRKSKIGNKPEVSGSERRSKRLAR